MPILTRFIGWCPLYTIPETSLQEIGIQEKIDGGFGIFSAMIAYGVVACVTYRHFDSCVDR